MTDGVTLSTPIKLPGDVHVGMWGERKEGELQANELVHAPIKLSASLSLTRSILLQAMTKMGFVSNKEEEASKCLKEMDLDGDGRVSYAEFMVKWRIT